MRCPANTFRFAAESRVRQDARHAELPAIRDPARSQRELRLLQSSKDHPLLKGASKGTLRHLKDKVRSVPRCRQWFLATQCQVRVRSA